MKVNILGKVTKSLSDRENEVAELLLLAYSNKEIANKMGLSVAGIKTHIRSIKNKLRAKNRTHIALILQEQQMKDGTYVSLEIRLSTEQKSR